MNLIFLLFLAYCYANAVPKKLAVYYGYPSSVNLHYTISGAVSVFSDYDLVVLGAGLEDPAHSDHQNTKDIINSAVTVDFFGYVDATLSNSAIEAAIDLWAVMGGSNHVCTGIFFDRFGFDFAITRSKQNAIVDYTHTAGMNVFVNAWFPEDVFEQVNGTNHHLSSGTDWYLSQSHYVKNGNWQPRTEWESKSDSMSSYAVSSGVNMACLTTTTSTIGFNQTKWNNAYYACAVYGFHASGWGEPNFSASDALLPWRTRLPINGTQFTGSLAKSSGVLKRPTNVGIRINTLVHETESLLS